MKYISPSEIKYISIDHTSKCNLACPQCARTDNELLPIGELTLDDYIRIIEPIAGGLTGLFYCGNYGDAIASNTLLPALRWLRNDSKFTGRIDIVTNGSLRDTKWWKELATLIGNNGSVRFSIDGLENTNHIYRINSNFNKILENAKTYIDAGGIAHWEYLVFKHNEHEVEKAQAVAKSLGFTTFKIKQTNRFIEYSYGKINADQIIKQPSNLEITSIEKYQGTVKSKHGAILEKYGSWKNYKDNAEITCKARAESRIFIDFEARLWACTWTAGGIYYNKPHDKQRDEAQDILNKYGRNFNSLRHYSLEEVLNHEYFSEKICASWNENTDSENPKLETCVRFCGHELETSSGWVVANNKNNETIQLK